MGYKLLLADDSITIQKVVSIIFANEDYDLTVVDNGNDTLAKAREIIPDVILVDALMPGKSGYDVCAEVRQDPVLKDIPLLLLVGAFEPFDEEKAARSGTDDHISKPFESQALIEKVKKLVALGEERAAASAAPAAETPLRELEGAPETGAVQSPQMQSAPEPSRTLAADSIAGEESLDVLSLDSMEVVEVTPEDDLWGAFEVTEVAEEEDVRLGDIVEGDELQPEIVDTEEEIEPFVFTEEEQVCAGDENTISLGECPVSAGDVVAETEESFVFREEPESMEFGDIAASGPSSDFAEPSAPDVADEKGSEVPMSEGLRFFREASASGVGAFVPPAVPEPALAQESPESEFAPEEQYAVSPDIVSAGIPESGAPGTINLSEEQLKAILANVSKEIIEKIAWEVVPDLAESIIREEIRKIKEGC